MALKLPYTYVPYYSVYCNKVQAVFSRGCNKVRIQILEHRQYPRDRVDTAVRIQNTLSPREKDFSVSVVLGRLYFIAL